MNVTAKWINFSKGTITVEVTIEVGSNWERYIDEVWCHLETFTSEMGIVIPHTNTGERYLSPTAGVTILSQNITSGALCSYSGADRQYTTSAINVIVKPKHDCKIGSLPMYTGSRIGTNPELKW